MNKYFLSCIFILVSQFSFSQNKNYALHIIDTLCSSSFYGRGYVNRGDSITSEFISNEFEKIGLKPVKGSYFQTFAHNVNTFPDKVFLANNGKTLIPGRQYLLDPRSGSAKGKSGILEITQSEILNNKWLQKLKKSNNKALYLDLSNLDSLSKKEKSKTLEFSNYLKFEKDIPAKVLLIGEEGKIPWSVSNKEGYRAVFILFKDSIDDPIKNINYEVDAKFIENYRSKNVMGIVPGKSKPDSVIVISAHYDHLGMMGSDVLFPGANDNASGVALLLDLSHYFAKNPIDYTICFVAFAGEEAGLVGSSHFVKNSPFSLKKIKFLLNLDLEGTGVDGITVVNAKLFEDEFNRLVKINSENNYVKEIKARGEACNSDHCPFHMAGVKCFYFYTLGGTKYYHDVFDRPSTLPLNEYENYFKLITEFIKEIE